MSWPIGCRGARQGRMLGERILCIVYVAVIYAKKFCAGLL